MGFKVKLSPLHEQRETDPTCIPAQIFTQTSVSSHFHLVTSKYKTSASCHGHMKTQNKTTHAQVILRYIYARTYTPQPPWGIE